MDTSGWVLLAFVFWCFGYMKSKFAIPLDGNFVILPKLVNIIICGLPQSDVLPGNAVLIVGLRSQLAAWFLAFYGLFAKNLIGDVLMSFLIGFVGSLITSKVVADLISRALLHHDDGI